MRRYADVVLNNLGVPQSGATITVTVAANPAGSGALATIYSDDGVTTTFNPVSTDNNGRFGFYVADGRYDLKATLNTGSSYIVADQDITSLTEAALFDNIIAVDGKQYALNSAGLNAAVSAAGSSGLVFISRPIVMSANVTVPSGVTLQFFQGGTITTTGWTLTLNGAIVAGNYPIFLGTGTITLSAVAAASGIVANWFPGGDCGAKINAASNALGTVAGRILVDQACGTTWTTQVHIGNGANFNYHTLQFTQPGTYTVSQCVIVSGYGAAIVGIPTGIGGASSGFKLGPVLIKAANSSNIPCVVQLGSGANVGEQSISDLVIDGNSANNPTGGVGVYVNLANRTGHYRVIVQNTPSHAWFFKSSTSGKESGAATMTSVFSISAKGDGVFILNSPDIGINGYSEFEVSGNSATVNTTSTTVTATAGSWSTDSSLVGTLFRINNAFTCSIAAIPSTTTITVGTCWNYPAGTQTTLSTLSGVPFSTGNGIELKDSATARLSEIDYGGNIMDGLLIWGTQSLKAGGQICCSASEFGNNFQNDIEVIGYDTVGAQNTSIGNTFVGGSFFGSNNRTPTNTYDCLHIVDGGQNTIVGNNFSTNAAPNAARYGVSIVETAGSRHLADTVGYNIYNTNFATGNFSDTTATTPAAGQMVAGQFRTNGGGNATQALDFFDTATTTHAQIRNSNSNLQFFSGGNGTTLGTFVAQMQSNAMVMQGTSIAGVAGQFTPNVAGATDLGTTALPWGNLWLGTAGTNNFKFAPAATAAARQINIADPLGTTTLPLTIASGQTALNTASITTATCDGGKAATATGTTATDTVDWAFNAAPTATNKYGAFLVVYAVPSTNTVTFYTCNPSATTSTPTAMSVNWSVRRP